MKSLRGVIALLVGALALPLTHAVEQTWVYAVQLSAAARFEPTRVELSWTADTLPVRHYTVHRKMVGDTTWSEGVVVGADATSFTDEGVEAGKIYEYQVLRHGVAFTATGYIAVGVNAPLTESRGRVILIIDRSIAEPLAGELARFENDLIGDGWVVVRKEVARDASPTDVRGVIKAEWETDRERTKAVVLIGHIPVVRSGNQNVDGHEARPMPADVFYGEMNGEWTDANGDGIYDPSTLPSDVELMVGRIDFADLPGQYSPIPYPSEVDLLKRYFNKNHAFRHAATRPRARALVGNQIGDGNGQAYAASGYRNFAALVGVGNVFTVNSDLGMPDEERWMSRLAGDDYLWAYACGAGSDMSIGAMGTHGQWGDAWSSDFQEKKAKGTFFLMFGSWFGDWAKPDNLLRSALTAPEHGLGAVYSGRPHMFLHHMGVGESIGFGVRLSQNNSGHYHNQVQRQLRGVHIALMGDPTLRMHQLAPPRDVTATAQGSEVVIAWNASRDNVLGYHVYRAANAAGPFTRLTEGVVGENRFVDARRPAEATVYLVRAVALQTSPSGSFYNGSQGITAGVDALSAALAAAQPAVSASNAVKPGDVVWFDDALPAGAIGYASDQDRWNWVATSPAPFSGGLAHQSDHAAGLHHHFFAFAATPLAVANGETVFAYVYLDPANPPRQVMLTWLAGDWEHRAYWGENLIEEGFDGTPARRHMGPLPPAGQWIRLEVPAAAVALENQNVTGMGFTLFDGRATWDRAGKSRP